jgi:putative molybdopterin biosynthesis protein
LEDLTRKGVRFINRQRGAGTRVLLDYQLSINRIKVSTIQGYDQEEYTHLGIAAAVASGRADCGLGIPAAAQSLNLDFIPLFDEIYQLIIPRKFAETSLLSPLFYLIRSSQFKRTVADMPGYDVSRMGILEAEV